MHSRILGVVSSSTALLVAVLLLSNAAVAQTPTAEPDSPAKTFPVYDPYPQIGRAHV